MIRHTQTTALLWIYFIEMNYNKVTRPFGIAFWYSKIQDGVGRQGRVSRWPRGSIDICRVNITNIVFISVYIQFLSKTMVYLWNLFWRCGSKAMFLTSDLCHWISKRGHRNSCITGIPWPVIVWINVCLMIFNDID